jgi:hypothetical protein
VQKKRHKRFTEEKIRITLNIADFVKPRRKLVVLLEFSQLLEVKKIGKRKYLQLVVLL